MAALVKKMPAKNNHSGSKLSHNADNTSPTQPNTILVKPLLFDAALINMGSTLLPDI